MLPVALAITHTLTTGLPTHDYGFSHFCYCYRLFSNVKWLHNITASSGIIFLSCLPAKGLTKSYNKLMQSWCTSYNTWHGK